MNFSVGHLVHFVVGPFLLVTTCPLICLIFCYFIQYCKASIHILYNDIMSYGVIGIFIEIIKNNIPSKQIWLIVFGYYVFQYMLYFMMPGEKAQGPTTENGYIPSYKQHGTICFLINVSLTFLGFFEFGLPLDKLFDNLIAFILVSITFAYFFTILLYVKGLVYPTYPKDVKYTGNFIYDYYTGLEKYPNVFGINAKQLINSRIGMTQWALISLCYYFKEYSYLKSISPNGIITAKDIITSPVFISAILQNIYLLKFFIWEIGYFHTLDVMHDSSGFYIMWGILSWVPAVYPFHTGVLLSYRLNQNHSKLMLNSLSLTHAVIIYLIGIISIYVNYDCDDQKIYVRSKKGECQIWGKPVKVVKAEYDIYERNKKVTKKSILLCSGYWGIARHFHYIPELIFALMICIPFYNASYLQYFYFFYLCLLLIDRTSRDDERCSQKYGKFWTEYCEHVPYKMLPPFY